LRYRVDCSVVNRRWQIMAASQKKGHNVIADAITAYGGVTWRTRNICKTIYKLYKKKKLHHLIKNKNSNINQTNNSKVINQPLTNMSHKS